MFSYENYVSLYISKETLTLFVKHFCDFLMIFSPSLGYLAQGIKFQRTHSSEGFSKYMCLILLFANILRIFFWIGKQFTVVLLYQSCVVILSQFYLIHMSLKYDSNSESNLLPITSIIASEKKKHGSNALLSLFNMKSIVNQKLFWKWESELEYYKFTLLFVMAFTMLCKVIGFNNMYFIDSIGAISAFSESIIAIPQIKENYFTKDCRNISFFMVFTWLIGDIFKTGYYIYTLSPKQLVVCGFFQVSLDITLTSQVFYYNSKIGKKEMKKEDSKKKDKEYKKSEEDMHLMNEGEDEINDDGIDIDISNKKEGKELKEQNNKDE